MYYPQHSAYPQNAAASQNPAELANALLAKGNSLISRLMYRGIRGELIAQPWLQNLRRQSPDQTVYAGYAAALLFSLVLMLLPGVVGMLITDIVWAGLAYLFFAIGTKLAHQFIAYGICLVGAVLALFSALYTVASIVDLASLNLAGAAVMLLLGLAVTVVSGAVLAYVGWQVHQGIKRLSSPGQ